MKTKEDNRGNGLIQPDQQGTEQNQKKGIKKIKTNQDGLMEREEIKVITEDGRELLKEN
jgi:hypothetical protein